MSRRSTRVRRIVQELGGVESLTHAMPADRIRSTRGGPNGEEASDAVITQPMSERKRALWFQWAARK